MTFLDSIKTCFSKYATFEGTAARSEYWWFFLFQILGSWFCEVFSHALQMGFSVVLILPSLAVGARRLHDTDRSGWWQLLCFIPVIGWIVLIIFLAQDSRPNRYAGTAEVVV